MAILLANPKAARFWRRLAVALCYGGGIWGVLGAGVAAFWNEPGAGLIIIFWPLVLGFWLVAPLVPTVTIGVALWAAERWRGRMLRPWAWALALVIGLAGPVLSLIADSLFIRGVVGIDVDRLTPLAAVLYVLVPPLAMLALTVRSVPSGDRCCAVCGHELGPWRSHCPNCGVVAWPARR